MSPSRFAETPPAPDAERSWTPSTESERFEAREQLRRMLASPLFKHSKRYPQLLRYVVEKTLDESPDQLKERTIGVEVFGRAPDYDTNLDHVVRTTAGEVRKRIAQYYHEPGRDSEIRIELPVGSYLPEFFRSARQASEPRPVDGAPPGARRRTVAIVCAAAVAGAGLAWALSLWSARPVRTALNVFWQPVLEAPGPVAVILGGTRSLSSYRDRVGPIEAFLERPGETPVTVRELHLSLSERIAVSDAMTLGRLTGVLQSGRKPYLVRQEGSATLKDMREGPAILIGAFNNKWTIKLTAGTRFWFDMDDNGNSWIRDRQNPSRGDWKMNWKTPYRSVKEDYGMVSRTLDPRTGRIVVVTAGLGKWGPLAAGEFLTETPHLDALIRKAPRGWSGNNLQAVLATHVINGDSGPPRLVEAQFW